MYAGTTIGDEVVLAVGAYCYSNQGYERYLDAGTQGVVTRIGALKVLVRVDDHNFPGSYWITRDGLAPGNPNGTALRDIGQVPPGGIDPNDPGLAWLWEDAAKLARIHNYCSEYDTICDKLGIPGRTRNITVRTRVGNTVLSATFKARSEKEAMELMRKDLIENGIPLPDTFVFEEAQ